MCDPTQVRELAQLIETSSGFVIRERDYPGLETFVAGRIRESGDIHDVRQYTNHLRRNPESPEWRRILSEITIKESYLFRGQAQFDGLRSVILPELMEGRQSRRIRVWCAGCARGEEAATLALIMTGCRELRNSDWEILATDVDDDALEDARRGVFGGRAVSKVPSRLLETYFTRRGAFFELDKTLRGRISYRRLNLVDPAAVVGAGPFDVAFLRNVLIYFRPEQQKRVVDSVDAALSPGGYLFLGPSESLIHLKSTLAARDLGGAFCYRRATGLPSEGTRRSIKTDPKGAAPLPVPTEVLPPRDLTKKRKKDPSLATRLEPVVTDLEAGRYQEAFAAIGGFKSEFPERPVVHLVEAIALQGAGDDTRAVLAYRAALYLAPEIGVIRFLLARTLRDLGRSRRASGEYRFALSNLQTTAPDLKAVLALAGLPDLETMKRECREMIESPV